MFLILFIHKYLNIKIFGKISFHVCNFMRSHIVKTALEKTSWGKGLLCFPAGEPKWRPPDFLKHRQTKSTTSYHHLRTETKLFYLFLFWKMFSEWVIVTLSFEVRAISHRLVVLLFNLAYYISGICKLCVQPPSLQCHEQQEK
jgi:hypothetical protein